MKDTIILLSQMTVCFRTINDEIQRVSPIASKTVLDAICWSKLGFARRIISTSVRIAQDQGVT